MDPSIAARRHRFEKPRLARLITQCPANLRDDAGEGVVGDGGTRPDEVEDFLFGEEVTRPLHHHSEKVECLGFKRDRNTAAFDDVDLVPNVLSGVETIDTSCTIMGRKSALPFVLSPTALQRVFHWQGERAVARAAEKFGLWFGISSLATVSIEEIAALVSTPKMFQFYYHKDRGLNRSMIERCRAAKFDADTLRVVIDLSAPVTPKSFSLPPNQQYGNRLVLDLYDEGADVSAGADVPVTTTPASEMPLLSASSSDAQASWQ